MTSGGMSGRGLRSMKAQKSVKLLSYRHSVPKRHTGKMTKSYKQVPRILRSLNLPSPTRKPSGKKRPSLDNPVQIPLAFLLRKKTPK